MNSTEVEAVLRHVQQTHKFLLDETSIERDHEIWPMTLSCDCCEEEVEVGQWVVKPCKDLTCPDCRRKEWRELEKNLRSMSIAPARFCQMVLPTAPVPLAQFNQEHVARLKTHMDKMRHQRWFADAVHGGRYVFECEVLARLEEEQDTLQVKLEVRLHAHVALELAKAAKDKPINVQVSNAAWRNLTGQSVQIKSLDKYTEEDLRHCLRYIAWKVGGVDMRDDFLHDLHEYMTKQKAELESLHEDRDVPQTRLHREYLRTLQENIQIAGNLLAYIVERLSNGLKGIHRHDAFGQWRGRERKENAKDAKISRDQACQRCGVVGSLHLVTPARNYS